MSPYSACFHSLPSVPRTVGAKPKGRTRGSEAGSRNGGATTGRMWRGGPIDEERDIETYDISVDHLRGGRDILSPTSVVAEEVAEDEVEASLDLNGASAGEDCAFGGGNARERYGQYGVSERAVRRAAAGRRAGGHVRGKGCLGCGGTRARVVAAVVEIHVDVTIFACSGSDRNPVPRAGSLCRFRDRGFKVGWNRARCGVREMRHPSVQKSVDEYTCNGLDAEEAHLLSGVYYEDAGFCGLGY
ncbi:hypothetical protein C8J57DRAFT_1239711 [Mycena rebaudengoi]|nr:hypothetical protein C8J57DRAFT_1239711 [Mycena rebaudengoi]